MISAAEVVLLRREGQGLTASEWATAVLYNGLGRNQEAYAAAAQAPGYWTGVFD